MSIYCTGYKTHGNPYNNLFLEWGQAFRIVSDNIFLKIRVIVYNNEMKNELKPLQIRVRYGKSEPFRNLFPKNFELFQTNKKNIINLAQCESGGNQSDTI